MKPLSSDLRQRIVRVYEDTPLSFRAVAARFQVSVSSVQRSVQQHRKQGHLTPAPHGGGQSMKLTAEVQQWLVEVANAQVDASQDELRQEVKARTGVDVSQPTVSRLLKQAGITRKKKTKRATEQDTPEVTAERQTFAEQQPQIRSADLVAIDDMGIITGMSRAYGYAPRGERAVAAELGGHGTRLSVVGALTVDGFLGGLEVLGTVNGDVVEAFITQIVVPHLQPGKIVLLDNARVHHRETLQELIEATGARVLFLPRYSPEYNPIELCWSKIKAWIRTCSPESVPVLQHAFTEAIQQVSKSDAAGWFRHAGFVFNTSK